MKLKDTFFSKKLTLNIRGQLMELSAPKVMGILNITPDSFYDGGKYTSADQIYQQAENMIAEGADFIDVGGYSSRPGAEHISVEEEKKRLDQALGTVRNKFPQALISVDTFRSDIARWAVENYAVDLINDISAGYMDQAMYATVADLKVPYIIMHMQGTPQNMQQNIKYNHFLKDIIKYFARIVHQLKILGVKDIIIDPGFGFGKTTDHNYRLMSCLDDFKIFELPVMVGVSRKSMIYKYLGGTAQDALNGTTVLQTLALTKGVNMLRVHDVKQAKETVQLYMKCIEMEEWGYENEAVHRNPE
ncbi:MAG: dihydropteroate synthase [Bacteroidetes bacterium]|nr:dihydropteroate synthase [Bacteroidota bacterium]